MEKTRNEYTHIILKPDFLEKNLIQKLKNLLEKFNLKIECQRLILMDLAFVKELYQWEEIFYSKELENYLCSMRLPVWLIHGNDAINKLLEIKKILRDAYPPHPLFTLIHCPDSHDDFLREYKLINNKLEGIMKTNNQIEVIVFKKDNDGYSFLMLKRNSKKGGFWQPITGNVDPGETFEDAAIRELFEETGVKELIRLFYTGFSFNFFDDGRNQIEKVYAVQIDKLTPIVISQEHEEYSWVNYADCQDKYLKYPGNKKGLETLKSILEKEE